MRWTRVARIVVAVVGLGAAAAILVSTQHRPTRPEPPTRLATVDPKAALEGTKGTTLIYRSGQSKISLSYQGVQTYEDGRMRYEVVKVEGLEGTRFTLNADALNTAGKSTADERPRQLEATGHVVMVTDDGLRLETDTATYDDATGRLLMPGAVTFTKGRLSGHAVGATYDREQDAIALLDQAVAKVQPDAKGQGSADATSTRMSLARGQHMLHLDGRARIVGETQTLTGNEATFTFTEDERAIKYLELRGSARVTPNLKSQADQPGMSADNITMMFREDGLTLQHATLTGQARLTIGGGASRVISASWIDLFTGPDGRTLSGLQAKDSVKVDLAATATTRAREITAAVLTASGDEQHGLTSARFEGNPRFEEAPPPGSGRGSSGTPRSDDRRTGTASILVLTLAGQLDAIESAEFQQKAKFESGDVTGWADVAQYDEAKGVLRLNPNARGPRQQPHVTTPDMTVDGWSITLRIDSQDLDAQGGVTTQSTRAPDQADRASLFGGKDPINGAADKLAFTKSSGLAVYTGSAAAQARLWQGQTSVVADQITFVDSSRNLHASGKVDSTFSFEPPASGATSSSLKSYRVHAETLEYDEARRTAVYKGPAVTLHTADGDIEALTLTFLLASTTRTLEEMRAEQRVWAMLSGGYEAVGERLTYHADREVYVLEGKTPDTARVKSPPDRSAGATPSSLCTVTESMNIEIDVRTGNVQSLGKGQAPKPASQIPCSESLRRPK